MRFTILLMMTVSLFVVGSFAQIPDLEGEWVAVSPKDPRHHAGGDHDRE